MASTSALLLSSSSSSPVFNPFSSSSSKAGTLIRPRSRIVASSRKEAHDHHQNYSSRLVDENMIVLRKRIHEMKMVERNYEPPAEWMDWEKRYYTSYDSIICQAMGLLQSQLMNTRPSLALAFMALIVFSVPASTFMVFSHLLEITKGALTGGFGL
ncbi:PREDICTED: uncharacterized protein LOC101294061 [Fragaria vesca subsp. vesca]|uniref:uncharacterized protein LOC101294061 n=1 Tax=Fragaria vesca subsp. vesca TaxID=101020 RepID=UPI0002C33260|nr:PREDICTED: uncharacterized protein LOC101294061 [Fragaria vesca subsp. vesca]